MKLSDQRVVKELTEKVIAEMEACKSGGKSWKPNWVGSLSGLPYNFITNNPFIYLKRVVLTDRHLCYCFHINGPIVVFVVFLL